MSPARPPLASPVGSRGLKLRVESCDCRTSQRARLTRFARLLPRRSDKPSGARLSLSPSSVADLIDASSWSQAAYSSSGDGVSGGYTTIVSFTYETGVAGKGVTIKPNGGDTSKTLFIPNAGIRNDTDGTAGRYGAQGFSWSAEENPNYTSQAWYLLFSSGSTYSSGYISNSTKLQARTIRCVRS